MSEEEIKPKETELDVKGWIVQYIEKSISSGKSFREMVKDLKSVKDLDSIFSNLAKLTGILPNKIDILEGKVDITPKVFQERFKKIEKIVSALDLGQINTNFKALEERLRRIEEKLGL